MLLLPVRSGTEAVCARKLRQEFRNLGIQSSDYAYWVLLQQQNWLEKKQASPELQRIVRTLIAASAQHVPDDASIYGEKLSRAYFHIHTKLMDEHLMSHSEATAFLSHAFLIAYLAAEEHLSAAQIARVMTQRDHRAKFSRQNIAALLQPLGINTDFTKPQIVALYHRDAKQELSVFSDADFFTAAQIVAEAGTTLGASADLTGPLCTLAPIYDGERINSPFTPYLQMLHYQCSIAEFADHALTYIYEFSPRGEKFEWLHRTYPDTIAGAANPFLNNAKSVDVLDIGWVRAKKTHERPGAMALLTILESMEAMGFPARRELAWWIRLWLHRIIRISSSVPLRVPNTLERGQIERLFDAIGQGNTNTFGILEQRSVDAVASVVHRGLRSRGLGDPVNATNLSSGKLGDCEFLNAHTSELFAYESHGGTLSAIYVEQHLATIKKSIPRRIEELTAIADLDAWTVHIKFIAHEVAEDIPRSVNFAGLKIEIDALTFAEFFFNRVRHEQEQEHYVEAIQNYLLEPLQKNRTPNEVRQRFLTIID